MISPDSGEMTPRKYNQLAQNRETNRMVVFLSKNIVGIKKYRKKSIKFGRGHYLLHTPRLKHYADSKYRIENFTR